MTDRVDPPATTGLTMDRRRANAQALEACAAALAGLGFPEAQRRTAYANIESWLVEQQFAAYEPRLLDLIDRACWDELFDAFWRTIPFGTGGRRGPVGVGPNRFNPHTLRSSVQGHCLRIAEHDASSHPAFARQPRRVVIAYDVREFHDFRGVYAPGIDDPLSRITSRDFARMAAEVYAAHGIEVWMPVAADARYMSTPELSFAIRHFSACGGLNISASHNPPDDNGGKFYNQHGAQEVPPEDAAMAQKVAQVREVHALDWQQAQKRGLIRDLGDECHAAYLELLLREIPAPPSGRALRVVFSPLCGTAGFSAGELLTRAGYDLRLELSQAQPDGSFASVPFRAPNPEVPQSMDAAVRTALAQDASIVLACDPDGDRIGASVADGCGQFRFLTGNELAAIACEHRLAQLGPEAAQPPVVIQTLVTTSLVERIARAHGAECVSDLLVGFKYHAHVIAELERCGRYKQLEAAPGQVVLAVEESHGILVTPQLRDKDGAGAALLLADAAASAHARGETLLDLLDRLHLEHGYVANRPRSLVMTGARGLAWMTAIQADLRAHPPTQLAEWSVSAFEDCADPTGPRGPILSDTDASARNVLVFKLGDSARVVVRPSGTEPKIKIYVEVCATRCDGPIEAGQLRQIREKTNARAERLADAMCATMLARVDIQLPDWAFRMSALASLELRRRVADDFMPQLVHAAIQPGATASDPALANCASLLTGDEWQLARPGIEYGLGMSGPLSPGEGIDLPADRREILVEFIERVMAGNVT